MTISLLGSPLAKLTVAAFLVAIAQPGMGQAIPSVTGFVVLHSG